MNRPGKAGEIQPKFFDVFETVFLVKAMTNGSGRQIDRKSKVSSTLLSPIYEETPCTSVPEVWMCI